MPNIEYELNEKIHAIIINPYLTWDNFNFNCDLIRKHSIRNVSTSLNFISHLKKSLGNYKANINALISYPFADLPIYFIEEFSCYAKDQGANGIEYTPNFFNLSKNNLDAFADELEKVQISRLPVTVIINKAKLEKEVFQKSIKISIELGIKNFQFGDGFGPPISSLDVNEILKMTSSQNVIKIVGGIKKLNQIIDLFDLGVNCVGTSNFCEIFEEVKVI